MVVRAKSPGATWTNECLTPETSSAEKLPLNTAPLLSGIHPMKLPSNALGGASGRVAPDCRSTT